MAVISTVKRRRGWRSQCAGVGRLRGFYDVDTEPNDRDLPPGTVVGTFDAVTTNAAVVGAFGATKQ